MISKEEPKLLSTPQILMPCSSAAAGLVPEALVQCFAVSTNAWGAWLPSPRFQRMEPLEARGAQPRQRVAAGVGPPAEISH